MIIAVCGIVFGNAAQSFAQTAEQIVGGYNKADIADREVVAAANFAVKAEAKKQTASFKLVAVNNAARQVVAGMNYQVCLSVERSDRRKKAVVPQVAQVVVYRNLKGKYSLTSWTIAACTDAAPVVPIK